MGSPECRLLCERESFHPREFALPSSKAITKCLFQEYENAAKEENCNPEVWVNLACTYFFLGMYKQAEAAGFKGKMGTLCMVLTISLCFVPNFISASKVCVL